VETTDLVERLACQRVPHGHERIRVADESRDAIVGSLVEQWQSRLGRQGRLIGVGIPVGTRDEQGEADGNLPYAIPAIHCLVHEPIRGDDGPRVEDRVLWGWESGS
jgi:hypothetical protein